MILFEIIFFIFVILFVISCLLIIATLIYVGLYKKRLKKRFLDLMEKSDYRKAARILAWLDFGYWAGVEINGCFYSIQKIDGGKQIVEECGDNWLTYKIKNN